VMTELVSSTPTTPVRGGLGRQLPKSASSSSLLSLQKRRDRRGSNPGALTGEWNRYTPSGSVAGGGGGGGGTRRPSVPSASQTTSDGIWMIGNRPPKPNRGLSTPNGQLLDPKLNNEAPRWLA